MLRSSSFQGLFCLVSLIATPVLAQQSPTPCNSDGECAADEFCALVPCAPPCDPAADPACVPQECGGGFCEARVIAPPACSSDGDCTDGQVCITQTYEECSGGSACACPSTEPNCDCPPPADPVCTTHDNSFCGPVSLAPCSVNDDCGPGFSCDAVSTCDCPVSSDGSSPPCDCAPPDEHTCVLQDLPCTTDDDCPGDLLCQDAASTAPCAVAEDGTTTCEAPTESAKVCAPEGYLLPVRADDALASGDPAAESGAPDDDTASDGNRQRIVFSCENTRADATLPIAALLLAFVRRAGRQRRR